MRKIAILLALGLAAASLLSGCKDAATTAVGTVQTSETIQKEASAQADVQVSDVQTGTTAAQAASATDTESAQTAGKAPSAAAASEKRDEGKTEHTAVTGGTTKGQAAEKTTVPKTSAVGQNTAAGKKEGTAKTSAATTKASAASSTAAAKPSVSPSDSDPVTTELSTTAKPSEASTTKPSVQTDAISGKLSYLNTATVTYLPALNAEDLKGFGITGDKAKEILKNKSGWTAYTIQIDFRNNTDKPVTIYYLDVTDNGKGEVYVCGDTAGELGMAANGKMSEKFLVLAKKEDSDLEVRNKLTHMAMRVQYAETPEDDMVTPKFQYSKIG